MTLFKKKSFEQKSITFDKDKIIREILEQRIEKCPGWNFFRISKSALLDPQFNKDYKNFQDGSPYLWFDGIAGDFLAIYTDMISEQIVVKGNPFSEYKKIVESPYQVVIDVFITDETTVDTYEHNNGNPQIYKIIVASSARELFVKLKKDVKKDHE